MDTVARLFKIEKAEELWKMSLIATLIPLALLILVYFPSVESMVKIWNRSDTYAHGFMIVPLFLWLVWRTRDVIKSNLPDAIPSITVLSALFGFVWVIAYLTDIQVAHQLLFVAIVQVIIVSIYGWHVARILAFPLIFLFFAVPMGEELVPVMIEFTADFTVGMVNLVGVPVYREGNYFELPTGRWSVVEACSGVRYLIASVALGFLYSYLTYSSLSKRTIFILVSIIVPIVANGVRAFLIVMIGHLSGMTLATGVDHLVYGWLFFGIVVGVMFFIGSYWRDEVETESVVNENSRVEDLAPKVKKLIMSSAILSLAIIVPPLGMGIYTQETH
ncbi:MAG: exosortase A, partial [Gammaproteobacteria bacterium]|nr:exosortase A [Gammaproteobacteria bacterium]